MGRFFPDPEDYPANRLFSLDLLRGLDIFLLTLLLSPDAARAGRSPGVVQGVPAVRERLSFLASFD